MAVRIETKRLVIREYLVDDFAYVHEYCQNPDVTLHMNWGPNSPVQTREFIDRSLDFATGDPRVIYELAVVCKDAGHVIGGIGLRIKNFSLREADMGYCYSPSVWGRGFGTEAAQAMLKFGFETLELHRIWATCALDNKGSEAIMRKNGMTKEAHFRQNEMIKGRWRDTLLYAMLDQEWRKLVG
jgi:RimJ/RimL family protein N-acetyltransferase